MTEKEHDIRKRDAWFEKRNIRLLSDKSNYVEALQVNVWKTRAFESLNEKILC